MSSSEIIEQAADRLWDAATTRKTCAPVRDILGETDVDAAYKVQQIITARKLARGEKRVGCKIGLTSAAVQQQLGVDQPDFGILTDQMMMSEQEAISADILMQPKIEAEIGFRLKEGLGGYEPTMEALVEAIDYAVAALEIVGSRVEGWNIRITDTVADNASASHFVLGAIHKKLEELDLVNCAMVMTRKQETVSEGSGKACLGNPLNAALWLSQKMNQMGTPLQAGDIILAGALGPMCNVQAGDVFTATIGALGSVKASFS